MRYPRASTEPLEIIRVNECEADPGLATNRFQALWNEVERLQTQVETLQNRDERWRMRMRDMRELAIAAKTTEIERMIFDLIMFGPDVTPTVGQATLGE